MDAGNVPHGEYRIHRCAEYNVRAVNESPKPPGFFLLEAEDWLAAAKVEQK